MIYDDQPQMVEAARRVGAEDASDEVETAERCDVAVRAAFDAIDREALIEKAATSLASFASRQWRGTFGGGWTPESHHDEPGVDPFWKVCAESVLVAAGIISKREPPQAEVDPYDTEEARLGNVGRVDPRYP